jgi:hypothetical protein
VARNLSSHGDRGNALLIKGSRMQKGDCADITIENVVVENSGPISVQAADGLGRTCGVSLRGATYSGYNSFGAAYVTSDNSGCLVSNISITGLVAEGPPSLLRVNAVGSVKAVTLDSSSLVFTNPQALAFINLGAAPNEVRAVNCRVNSSSVNQVGTVFSSQTLSSRSDSMSQGILPAQVLVTYVKTNAIFVVWTNLWNIRTSLIAVGDPVRLTSGGLAGVYTNLGTGICPANDDPVPGAKAGNPYLRLGWTAAAPGPIPNSGFQPGKILAQVLPLLDNADQSIDCQVAGGARNTIAGTSETGTARASLRTLNNTLFINAYSGFDATNTPIIVGCTPYLWTSGDHVDVGLFGNGTAEPAWANGRFDEPYVSISLSGHTAIVKPTSSW